MSGALPVCVLVVGLLGAAEGPELAMRPEQNRDVTLLVLGQLPPVDIGDGLWAEELHLRHRVIDILIEGPTPGVLSLHHPDAEREPLATSASFRITWRGAGPAPPAVRRLVDGVGAADDGHFRPVRRADLDDARVSLRLGLTWLFVALWFLLALDLLLAARPPTARVGAAGLGVAIAWAAAVGLPEVLNALALTPAAPWTATLPTAAAALPTALHLLVGVPALDLAPWVTLAAVGAAVAVASARADRPTLAVGALLLVPLAPLAITGADPGFVMAALALGFAAGPRLSTGALVFACGPPGWVVLAAVTAARRRPDREAGIQLGALLALGATAFWDPWLAVGAAAPFVAALAVRYVPLPPRAAAVAGVAGVALAAWLAPAAGDPTLDALRGDVAARIRAARPPCVAAVASDAEGWPAVIDDALRERPFIRIGPRPSDPEPGTPGTCLVLADPRGSELVASAPRTAALSTTSAVQLWRADAVALAQRFNEVGARPALIISDYGDGRVPFTVWDIRPALWSDGMGAPDSRDLEPTP